jgi:hypothetical protein
MGQELYPGTRPKHFLRVRPKRIDASRSAGPLRLLQDRFDDAAMSEVDSVEISDRQNGMISSEIKGLNTANMLHRR